MVSIEDCKQCSNCRMLKSFECFYKRGNGYSSRCRPCVAEYYKQRSDYYEAYRKNNRERISLRAKEDREKNREAISVKMKAKRARQDPEVLREKSRAYRIKFADAIRERKRLEREKNREQMKAYLKEYRAKNKEALNAKQREFYRDNKERLKPVHRAYSKANVKRRSATDTARRKVDPHFRLTCALRTRLSVAIRNNWKSGSAVRDLGCTIPELKAHLEAKFTEGMSWGNYGRWQIDHIRPLAIFDLTDRAQLLEACHFSNLQPLWAADNASKGKRIIPCADP